MSVSKASIPRLQEVAMLGSAVLAIEEGAPFEQVRLSLIELMRQSSDDPDHPKWARRKQEPTAYVHNVVDALKELMRLGILEQANLPSTPNSARAHRSETYTLTALGAAWAGELRDSRASAYNRLVGWLIEHHRQFEAYLRVVGARPDSVNDQLTIPLLRWSESAEPRTRESFLRDFATYAGNAAAHGHLGWSARPETLVEEVSSYVNRIVARAEASGRHTNNKLVEREAEKGLVKAAFAAAGVPIDYITVQLLGRWTRYLGLATFSYQAAQPRALRLWGTAVVSGSGQSVMIERRIGGDVRDRILRELAEVFAEHQRRIAHAMYMPVWEARAQVCWRLRVDDSEFDRAITEMLAQVRGQELPWEPHLDQASLGPIPSPRDPLVIPTRSGNPRTFNVLNLAPRKSKETP
jgi:hypothetical protein